MLFFPSYTNRHVNLSMKQSIERCRGKIEDLEGPERVPSDTVVTHDVLMMRGEPKGELPLGFRCRGVWNGSEGESIGMILERPVTAREFRARRAAEREEQAKQEAAERIAKQRRAHEESEARKLHAEHAEKKAGKPQLAMWFRQIKADKPVKDTELSTQHPD